MPTKGTPVRSVRVPDDVWDPAQARATAEGKTLTPVIVAALKRYGARPPRGTKKR